MLRLAGASIGTAVRVTSLVSHRVGFAALVLFALLLMVLPLLHGARDCGFLLLAVRRLPPLLMVALTVAVSVAVASTGLL